MSEPRLRNTKRDISLRNHDRLTYFISIVTSTYALSPGRRRLRTTPPA